ncbi:ribonuclease Z [Sedimentibacter acidaminivorans]|uniref:Ribonuclease Z n=1 Tax=Sedimentibacter acidaminivorans TaxID=913099 RepID=A0ABS4GCW8_9FIRM|nr:ribonuclease Z [Sedimentibacter acidaminivorans]MBP1925487.1 ribonuclease Z [Sedimentibacter acidaminivorans]
MINVTLIGTGGMIPLPNRFLASCLIEYNGKSILIDCGEGCQISLHKGKLSINKIEVILITHCHADHITGLPGLLLTIGNQSRTEPLYIMGPKGSYEIINSLLMVCGYLPFEVRIIEISDDKPVQFEHIGLNITSIPLSHHISCLGYSLELKLKPHFLPEKAKKLNIPVGFWRLLHNGENIQIDDNTITPNMVLGEERNPIKISYVTDTRPTKYINEVVKDSDLFICEGMYGDDEQYENALDKKHMLFSEAANIAKAANVKELWLTHYSPSLKNPEDYIENTTKIFSNTFTGFDLMTKKITSK